VQPAVYDITIYQRATFRRQVNLPLSLIGHTVTAQVWDEKRRSKIFDFDIEWINRGNGTFYLVADFDKTTRMKKDGEWDLMVSYPNGDRFYWVEGKAIFDPGYTDPDD
jgi:hypothetical protein